VEYGWSTDLRGSMALAQITHGTMGDCMDYDSTLLTLQLQHEEYDKYWFRMQSSDNSSLVCCEVGFSSAPVIVPSLCVTTRAGPQ
jgi:hypothetical protein